MTGAKTAKGNKDSNIKLYSDGLERDMQVTVRALQAKGGNTAFRTAIWSHNGVEGSRIEWFKAWQDGQGLWTVDRYEGLPGPDGLFHKKNAFSGACFFDALRYCAEAEQAALSLGALTQAEAPGTAGLVHLRAAGEESGVPFVDDLPRPAAGGNILEDDVYLDARALEIASQTQGMALQPVPPQQQGQPQGFALTFNVPVKTDIQNQEFVIPKTSMAKGELRNSLADAIRLSDRVESNVVAAVGNNCRSFKESMTRSDWLFLTVGVITIAPAVGWWIEGCETKLLHEKKFLTSCCDLENLTLAITDPAAKSLTQDFVKAARAAYCLEKAGAILRAGEGKKKAAKKAFSFLDKAASSGAVSQDNVDKLKDAFNKSGNYPEKGFFVDHIKAQQGELAQKLRSFQVKLY